jgi:hypothetical protein
LRLAAVAVLLVVAGVWAGVSRASEADELLEAGIERYDKGDFAGAIAALKQARDLYSKQQPLPEDELNRTFYYLGMAYIGLNETELAKGMFQSALLLRPELQLDPTQHSPRVIEIFESARREVAGSLVVRSDPPGAEVHLEGVKVGRTPFHRPHLVAGDYRIMLRHPGYRTDHFTFHVQSGRTNTVERTLVKSEGVVANIAHYPPKRALVGQPLVLEARVERESHDSPVTLHHRLGGQSEYRTKEMVRVTRTLYRVVLSGEETLTNEIQYYISMETGPGVELSSGFAESPHVLKLEAGDDSPPEIRHWPVGAVLRDEPFQVTALVEDDIGLSSVTLTVTDGAGEEVSTEMAPLQGVCWSATLRPGSLAPGEGRYVIRAEDLWGNERVLDPVSFTVLEAPAEGVGPCNVRFGKVSAGEVVLEWSWPEAVRVAVAGDPEGPFVELAAAARGELRDEPQRGKVFEPGRLRYYRLSPAGEEEPAVILAAAPNPALDPPEGFAGELRDKSRIVLTWEPRRLREVAGYVIGTAISWAGHYEVLARVEGRKKREYVDRAREAWPAGSARFYRIAVLQRNGVGGPWSAPLIVSIPPRPVKPEGFSTVVKQARRVALRWFPMFDPAVVGYIVERSTSPGGPFEEIAFVKGLRSSTYMDLGDKGRPLEESRRYYYRLRARDRHWQVSEPCEPVSAAPKAAPEPPAHLNASQGVKGKVVLSWDPVEGAAQYLIYRERRGENRLLATVEGGQTSYEDRAVKKGVRYIYRVKSVDRDSLESEFSVEAVGEAK